MAGPPPASTIKASNSNSGGGKITMTNSWITTMQSHNVGSLYRGWRVDDAEWRHDHGERNNSEGVISVNGATTKLTGTSITATALGGTGVQVGGGTFIGANISIVTQGQIDTANNYGVNGIVVGNIEGYSGGTVSLTNCDVSIAGDNSAVLTRDGASTTISGGALTSSGQSNGALTTEGSGSSASVTGTTITTTGNGEKGAQTLGTGSQMTLDNVNYDLRGLDSNNYTGSAIFNGTSGNGAYVGGGKVTLQNLTIVTSGYEGRGIENENGGILSDTGSSITTQGAQADGVLASLGSSTSLTGTQIQAFGNGAKGLSVLDPGTTLTATNVTIATSGTIDPPTGNHAQGVYNGAANSTASTGGAIVTLNNSTISTSGVDAVGVDTENGGLTTINGGAVSTSGAASYAVSSAYGGVTKLFGISISTTNNGSGGLSVNDAGSELDATGVTVTTAGAYDPTSGQHSYGAYNGPFGSETSGGILKITNSSLSRRAPEWQAYSLPLAL